MYFRKELKIGTNIKITYLPNNIKMLTIAKEQITDKLRFKSIIIKYKILKLKCRPTFSLALNKI